MIEGWMTEGNRVSKATFDAHYRDGDFVGDPMISNFGDGYGEPYNPNREAWGVLKDGTKVWAWVRGPKSTE